MHETSRWRPFPGFANASWCVVFWLCGGVRHEPHTAASQVISILPLKVAISPELPNHGLTFHSTISSHFPPTGCPSSRRVKAVLGRRVSSPSLHAVRSRSLRRKILVYSDQFRGGERGQNYSQSSSSPSAGCAKMSGGHRGRQGSTTRAPAVLHRTTRIDLYP